MNRNIKGAIAAGIMIASGEMLAACDPVKETTFEAFNQAAAEYNLSVVGLIGLSACESGLNPNSTNGSHDGLFQQARQYWNGRVNTYNANHPNAPVEKNIRGIKSNTLVSADMMDTIQAIRRNWTCESKTRCYTAPDVNKACKPDFWKNELTKNGKAIIGNRIVDLNPVRAVKIAKREKKIQNTVDSFAASYF